MPSCCHNTNHKSTVELLPQEASPHDASPVQYGSYKAIDALFLLAQLYLGLSSLTAAARVSKIILHLKDTENIDDIFSVIHIFLVTFVSSQLFLIYPILSKGLQLSEKLLIKCTQRNAKTEAHNHALLNLMHQKGTRFESSLLAFSFLFSFLAIHSVTESAQYNTNQTHLTYQDLEQRIKQASFCKFINSF